MRADSSQLASEGAPQRADAVRNRERILAAARAVFTERGIDAPMAAVARSAGLGTATLYRHFATRDALIVAAFEQQIRACTGVVDDALADPRPWHSFAAAVEKVAVMGAVDRGFSAAVLHAFPRAFDLEDLRTRTELGIERLIARAKAAGVLRADFDRTDLTLLFMAVDGVRGAAPGESAAGARRLASHLLRSSATVAAPVPPLPPPAPVGTSPH
ncbi:TetR/AcrR family transcriptional regulator [Nocardiopsis coralliicola]